MSRRIRFSEDVEHMTDDSSSSNDADYDYSTAGHTPYHERSMERGRARYSHRLRRSNSPVSRDLDFDDFDRSDRNRRRSVRYRSPTPGPSRSRSKAARRLSDDSPRSTRSQLARSRPRDSRGRFLPTGKSSRRYAEKKTTSRRAYGRGSNRRSALSARSALEPSSRRYYTRNSSRH